MALGVVQAIASVLAFVCACAVLLAGADYLGVGPGAVPVLICCPLGTIAGISMVVRPTFGACRAAAVWDGLVGLFCMLGALSGSQFNLELFIFATILVAMFAFLIEVDPVE